MHGRQVYVHHKTAVELENMKNAKINIWNDHGKKLRE
jgi:hypothetical protein